jgi:hypothetical protein
MKLKTGSRNPQLMQLHKVRDPSLILIPSLLKMNLKFGWEKIEIGMGKNNHCD